MAVLADTHIPGRARALPPAAWDVLGGCELVLHAGDVVGETLLGEIARARPVHAVRGNNDRHMKRLPERLELNIEGVRLAMVHDSGARDGRRPRLRRWFPDARVVVFGHSHIPFAEDEDGLLLVNPGSPTDRRRMPTHTMAVLTIDGGHPTAELIDLGRERA
ncbi:MAG: metallophosphoesterase [Candidatus Dormibacteria bacterium]